MTRFVLAAMIWLLMTFAMLWWVQTAVDEFHREAAASIGMAVQIKVPTEIEGDEAATRALARALEEYQLSPKRLQELESDHQELMRRMRLFWIAMTLIPLLVGAWWVVQDSSQKNQVDEADSNGMAPPA